MAYIEPTQQVALEIVAANRFYGVPGVEEVRREDIPDGIVFWVRGNNLSDEALDALAAIDVMLSREFPGQLNHVEVTDRFDCPVLRSNFWERLSLVKPITHLSATTSETG